MILLSHMIKLKNLYVRHKRRTRFFIRIILYLLTLFVKYLFYYAILSLSLSLSLSLNLMQHLFPTLTEFW